MKINSETTFLFINGKLYPIDAFSHQCTPQACYYKVDQDEIDRIEANEIAEKMIAYQRGRGIEPMMTTDLLNPPSPVGMTMQEIKEMYYD